MDRAQADALISELANQLSLPDLALDASGVCSIALDDGDILVHIGHETAARRLNFMICIDEVAPSGAQLFDVLAANFDGVMTGGGFFSVEAATGALVLQRRMGADELQGNAIVQVLEALVNAAEYWAKKLSAGDQSGESVAGDSRGPGLGMELRV